MMGGWVLVSGKGPTVTSGTASSVCHWALGLWQFTLYCLIQGLETEEWGLVTVGFLRSDENAHGISPHCG